MSSASPYEPESAVGSRQPVGIEAFRGVCLPAVRFVGFWAAVVSPFVLLTLLVTGFIVEQPFVAGGLLAVNLVGLVVGQNYNR